MLQFAAATSDSDMLAFALERRVDVNAGSSVRLHETFVLTLIYTLQSSVVPLCTPLHIMACRDFSKGIESLPPRTNMNRQDQVSCVPAALF